MILRLAEKTIEIRNLYQYVEDYCKDYLVDVSKASTIDFCISIEYEDIEYEHEKSAKDDLKSGRSIIKYSDEYLETLAVYRKIANALIEDDSIVFHGSVIAVDGNGIIFTAKSGTGKSTHARLWRELLGERVIAVNDDKPILKIGNGEIIAYGTPWDGKHRLNSNVAVPVKQICLINRAKENSIIRLSNPMEIKEIYPEIMQQVYRPKDSAKMIKTFKLVERMMKLTELYSINCNMNPNAAKLAYEKIVERRA